MRTAGVFLASFLAPSVALAAPESQDFSPDLELELLGFDDQTFDTGWIPANSPVQMRFYVHAGNSIFIAMPGDAQYDWEAETIRFEGHPETGIFEYDLGLEIEAKVRFDVEGQVWESDLLGPYDWAIVADDAFTPYLLEGNPDRPSEIHDETDFINIASVPLTPNLIVAQGTLDIDLKAVIDASLQGNRIDVEATNPSGGAAVITIEGESAPLDPGEDVVPFEVEGTLVCDLATAPDVVIYPHLVFTIVGQDFDIGGIEIPVDLPTIEDELELEPLPMQFHDRPEPEGDTDPEDTEDSSGSDDDGGTGDGGANSESGCGCRAVDSPPASALSLLALVALGRRRTRAV